jgi:hypothetical protein
MNYEEKLNSLRLSDADGDLSYTIHINSAIKVCAELENEYLKSSIDFALKKEKEVEGLKEIIRSAHEIAKRESSLEKTNWEAFAKQCLNILNGK